MTLESAAWWMGIVVIAAPAVLVTAMATTTLLAITISESAIARLTQTCVVSGFLASLFEFAYMLLSGNRHIEIKLGEWVSVVDEHHMNPFHFELQFVFDRLSVPFVLLSFVLIGTIGAFAQRYLHRERGYSRFFMLYALFLLGMVVATLAGTVETLFLGWEFVGLSSALLVAFFQNRSAPVRNGQRVWSVYRIADAAFLVAAIALHHNVGAGDFSVLMGTGPWPYGQASLPSEVAIPIGLLLLIAVAGKSALLPFCEWLPRAMEGPTPSSAVFYGALSVHLGTYLLLRVSPLIQLSWVLGFVVVSLGLSTALYAARVARVQTDVKSALAFASLTQVGLITAEIGLGWNYFALAHMIGHASLRALQLLRASSLLDDQFSLENAVGGHLLHGEEPQRATPALLSGYRFAINRGSLDAWLDRLVVLPFLRVFQYCDDFECHVTSLLSHTNAPQDWSGVLPAAKSDTEAA